MPRRAPFPTRHPATPFTSACFGLLFAAALLLAAPAQAAEAVIVEVYQECRLIDTNVVIDDAALAGADSGEVKARVAAATRDPQLAVPRIVQILKEYGIDDVSVSQQGLAGCEPETSGKFVEAVGRYCGPALRHAEVFVDRQSFISSERPGTSFEAFLKKAVRQLRDAGIYDRPLVSIENAPDCEQED